MRKNELVRKYAKKVHECLSDPVAFSKVLPEAVDFQGRMTMLIDLRS